MRILALFLFSVSVLAGVTGNIRGVVKDEKGEPIGGVTVVATSPVLQGEQPSMTDEHGIYVLSNLPQGTYVLKAMFAEAISERTGIDVYIDKTVEGNMVLKLTEAKGEVYQINEKANHIDVASSTVGVNLSKEYIKNVPLGRDRNFTNAVNALPSATTDGYGDSVGGASSPENQYVIDGQNETDPSTGLSGTRMVMEFVDEFDVKEGGYGPELGRATGGVINAATKTGSNEFHGSVFLYYRPGFLQATPKLVVRANDSIVRRGKLDYYLNLGAEVGGPIIHDKLWFHLGYAPELQKDYFIREVNPILPGQGRQDQLRNAFGQLQFGPPVFSQQFAGFSQAHQYTMKLTHKINDTNRQSLTVRGSPTLFDGSVGSAFEGDAPTLSLAGDPSSFNYKQWGGNIISSVYSYAGQYFNEKLKFDGLLAVHHQQNHWVPTLSNIGDSAASYVFPQGAPLGAVWSGDTGGNNFNELLGASSKYVFRTYTKGGIGGFNDSMVTRFSQKLMLTNLFDFAGLHQLKYGIDFEQLRGQKEHGYTGGAFYEIYQNYIQETQYHVRGFGDIGASQGYKFPSIAQTLNWALFMGDSWNPTSNLTLNYGVRWEAQDFYGVQKPAMKLSDLSLEKKFSILDNVAPRAGIVWDWSGNGKGVVRFNYGRYYESVPMDLNERAFGGEGTRIRQWNYTGNQCGPGVSVQQCKTNLENVKPSMDQTLGGRDSFVAPGMKGQYSDEFVLSADYEPITTWVFGVAGIYRNLGRVIEDMSVDGGSSYMFGNPGSFDVSSLDSIRTEINYTQDPAKRALLEQKYTSLARINEYPKPVRDVWQLQFKLDKKISDNFVILATYVLSWAHGNYPGLVTANNGQLDPNLTSMFDLPQLMINRMGYLPQDQRHRIKLSGFYKLALKDFGVSVPLSFNVGLSGAVQSGSPYEVLGRDQVYGNNEIFILPRGSGGRMPWTWTVDLMLGAAYDITEGITAELFASLYNLTNNQAPTSYDNTYTFDNVRPIIDGGKDQLDYAMNVNGAPINKNPNYGNPTSYQAPFSTQLGFRLKF